MLFSAINTLRFLLYNLRICVLFFIFVLSFTFQQYISGRKRGAKGQGYVGPEFSYPVILTRDVCIEID